MRRSRATWRGVALATVVGIVAACGGGTGEDAASSTTPSTTVSSSAAPDATTTTAPTTTASTTTPPTATSTVATTTTKATRPPLDLRPYLLKLPDLPAGLVARAENINFRATVPIVDPCGTEVLPMAAYPGPASTYDLPPPSARPTGGLIYSLMTAMQQMPEIGTRSIPAEVAAAVATCPATFPSRQEQWTTSVRLLETTSAAGITVTGFEHAYETGPVTSRRLVYVYQLDELVGTLVVMGAAQDLSTVADLGAPLLATALAKLAPCIEKKGC